MRRNAEVITLQGVDVECTHCNVRMSHHLGSSGQVQYFQCPSCQRWVTSMYTEVFRSDAKVRTRLPESNNSYSRFSSVRERLAQWLSALNFADPYRVLGCTSADDNETIQRAYRALAHQHHPDRGGSAESMRKINDAYERVVAMREGRIAQPLTRQIAV